jgi:hypothetical protein
MANVPVKTVKPVKPNDWRNLRKVEFTTAIHLLYAGFTPNRVEAFDNERPFYYFNVPELDYEATVQEVQGIVPCTVELKGMLDAVNKAREYARLAKASGVYLVPKV